MYRLFRVTFSVTDEKGYELFEQVFVGVPITAKSIETDMAEALLAAHRLRAFGKAIRIELESEKGLFII